MLLEWGSCGRVAYVDDDPAGYVLYAPPTYLPGADAFPTAPVSEDAVLLATAMVYPEYAGQGLGRMLMQAVVKDLVKRGGIRAVEAFGDTRAAARAERGDPTTYGGCVLPADYLLRVGFKTHRPHPRYPRMRLELQVGGHLARRGGERAGAAAGRRTTGAAPGRGPVHRCRRNARRRVSAGPVRAVGRGGAELAEPEHAGLGVGLGVEVDPLHRDHDGLGDHVAERRVGEPGGVAGVGEVAGVDPDRGHLGAAQDVAGLGVRAQVAQVGAGDDLPLDQTGEPLADRGARRRAPRSRRSTSRRRPRPGWPSRRPAARCTGARRSRLANSARSTSVASDGAAGVGEEGLHAGRDQPALDPAGQVGGDRVGAQPHARGPRSRPRPTGR